MLYWLNESVLIDVSGVLQKAKRQVGYFDERNLYT